MIIKEKNVKKSLNSFRIYNKRYLSTSRNNVYNYICDQILSSSNYNQYAFMRPLLVLDYEHPLKEWAHFERLDFFLAYLPKEVNYTGPLSGSY